MRKVTVKVHCPAGLHLREVGKLVELSKAFKSALRICNGCLHAEGCSILELLLLNAPFGAELDVIAEGEDEVQAVEAVARVINSNVAQSKIGD